MSSLLRSMGLSRSASSSSGGGGSGSAHVSSGTGPFNDSHQNEAALQEACEEGVFLNIDPYHNTLHLTTLVDLFSFLFSPYLTFTGDLPKAQRLYRAGAHDAIRSKNEYGETCMHLACQGGSVVVSTKNDNHLPVSASCQKKKSRASFNIHSSSSFLLQVARWLYVAGAAEDIHALSNDGDSCMLLAALGGHLGTAKWLYEAGCVDEVHVQNKHGNNPMHFACRQGNLEVAKWLVSVQLDDRDDVRLANHQNNTPMHFACRGGHLEVCIWLAAQGASEDVRVANAYGWTPMHSAHWKGHRGIVDWLMGAGAADDMETEDNEGHVPMHWAQRAKNGKKL